MRNLPNQLIPRQKPARGGFTIIELMVAVVIIAALAALLLPAIQGARTRAQETSVRQEISQLESAIAEFKAEFGREPPSFIRLYETGNAAGTTGWFDDSTLEYAARARESRAIIRAMFPKFDFSAFTLDLNGNGSADANLFVELRGDQCLWFFLGGVYSPDTGYQGFSKNQSNPFTFGTATRIGPFFEFDVTRIADDVTDLSGAPDYTSAGRAPLNRFPVYLDPLPGQTKPYLYVSSDDGRGYRSTIFAAPHTADSDLTTPVSPTMNQVYIINTKLLVTDPNPAPWKPRSFQLISPGFDGEYGTGGVFKPEGDIALPALIRDTAPPNNDLPDSDRYPERDNITNFHTGRLDP